MRSVAIALCALFFSAVVIPAAVAAPAVAFQINRAHSGVQVDATLYPPYTKRWHVTFSGFVSYPLIAQGLVFVTVGDPVTNAPILYALDQQTGQTVWSRSLAQPPPVNTAWATAAYDDGRVFAVGSAGLTTAFDAATGAIVWSHTLPGQYVFTAPPTAGNGIVYVGGAGSGGTLYAVDQATGTVLNTRPVTNGDSSAPTLSTADVFVAYACNQVSAFIQAGLAPLWIFTTFCEGGGGKTSVYDGGRLFTRDNFGNLVLNAATGALIGEYVPDNNQLNIAAVRGNRMWVNTKSTLLANDISDVAQQSTLWSFAGDGRLITAPIVIQTAHGDVILVGSASGTLYALDGGGSVLWNLDVGAAMLAPLESGWQPLQSLAAGDGLLVVPAGTTLTAFVGPAPPPVPPVGVPSLSSIGLLALLVALAAMATFVLRGRGD